MPSKVESILLAAIMERQELVQQLWFYGHEREASEQYTELKALRAKLREVRNANSRSSNPGASGNPQAE
jgi:hypothetical protein